MLKKILYAIVVIVIIVILAIMWTDSKNKKVEAPLVNSENTTTQSDTTASINSELDSINVDSGIDTDLKSVDADVKTL